MGCLPPPGRDWPRGQTRTAAPRRPQASPAQGR
jgi:hypothetical protein